MTPTSFELREELRVKFDETLHTLNAVLAGKGVKGLEEVLCRIGRGGKLPHWYPQLCSKGTLPNLDGKTIGSVIEMLFLAVLERHTFRDRGLKLRVNPARGTDLPDLDLSIKSPSTNYCTSEPFFSAYERLIGSKHDAVVLLTDYQERKETPPLKLQIIKWRYLASTEIADEGLCNIGRRNREFLLTKNEVWAQKFFRFLAFVNQSDWLARQLLGVAAAMQQPAVVSEMLSAAEVDFAKKNREYAKKLKPLLSDKDLEAIRSIGRASPQHLGIIDALDSWVVENLQEAGRMPGADEWKLIKDGPLNGKIGMSFALQWRFNFGRVFGASDLLPVG